MSDFYEIDFLPVHRSDSGDAISIRYQVGDHWSVHVVDGGYESTAEAFAAHIRKHYGTNRINRVIVTHPDQDHAEGLAPILEDFEVEELWMLCPWDYADHLLPHFARYTDADRLRARLREDYPYIAELESIALRKGIHIREPFQGQRIGSFTVLAPSPVRYLNLILESEKTPQHSVRSKGIVGAIIEMAKPIVRFIKSGWGSERFSAESTSIENEMSVVQYANLCGQKVLADAHIVGGIKKFVPYSKEPWKSPRDFVEAVERALQGKGSSGHQWPPIINLSDAEGYRFKTGSAELSLEFRRALLETTPSKIIDIIKEFDVDVIEVVGHTDEQPLGVRQSNLDRDLVPVLKNEVSVSTLTPGDNAGLGLARAVSVVSVLRQSIDLKPYKVIPLSGAQLVNNDETLSLAGAPGDISERRRIEIRLRKSTPRETSVRTTQAQPPIPKPQQPRSPTAAPNPSLSPINIVPGWLPNQQEYQNRRSKEP